MLLFIPSVDFQYVEILRTLLPCRKIGKDSYDRQQRILCHRMFFLCFRRHLKVSIPIQHHWHHIRAQQYLLPHIIRQTNFPAVYDFMVAVDRVDHIVTFKILSLMVDGSCRLSRLPVAVDVVFERRTLSVDPAWCDVAVDTEPKSLQEGSQFAPVT